MLHITNGDSTGHSLVRSGLDGDIIAWRDVLHEGPVPAGLSLEALSEVRARFIASSGWTESVEDTIEGFAARDRALRESLTEDEVVLWFEHDLYDQLQLIQLLDWFADHRHERQRLSLVSHAEYLGTLAPKGLVERFPGRAPVTQDQLELARRAWRAFRSSDPREIEQLLAGNTSALPFLASALHRHLQQFPAVDSGLSRSERQALASCADEPTAIAAAFLLSQEFDEPASFLGDTTFAGYLARLGRGPAPCIRFADGAAFAAPTSAGMTAEFWQREIVLTETGHAVLCGDSDWIAIAGIDHWLGGVHLTRDHLWRWDEIAGHLIPPA